MWFLSAAVTTLSSTTSTSSEVNDITTDQVSNMAGIINQYGPTVVILAVFILIFIVLLSFIIKSNHKMNQQMLESQKTASEANQKMMQEMFDTCMSLIKQDKTDKSEDDEDGDADKKKETGR